MLTLTATETLLDRVENPKYPDVLFLTRDERILIQYLVQSYRIELLRALKAAKERRSKTLAKGRAAGTKLVAETTTSRKKGNGSRSTKERGTSRTGRSSRTRG